MPNWYLDPGLVVLRRQVQGAHPGVTIYTIGDDKHSSQVSDHNPDPDGSVDAIDIMIGKNFTHADADQVTASLVRSRDRRIKYIIWDRMFWEPNPGVWVRYTGSNPHTDHIHLSVNDNHRSTDPWSIAPREVNMKYIEFTVRLPILTQGLDDADYPGWNHIGRIQDLRGLTIDGNYGPQTAANIKELGDGSTGKTISEKEYRAIYGLGYPLK